MDANEANLMSQSQRTEMRRKLRLALREARDEGMEPYEMARFAVKAMKRIGWDTLAIQGDESDQLIEIWDTRGSFNGAEATVDGESFDNICIQ